jgi:hypothetical protein
VVRAAFALESSFLLYAMNHRCLVFLLLVGLAGFLALPRAERAWSAETGLAGGKLTEADQKKFAQRFRREVWPLLTRRGKDGCVGCHHSRHRTELRFSGKPNPDFAMLLKDGFLLPEDAGSLLTVVTAPKRKGRMPPGNRPAWTPAEVKVLRAFEKDLNKSLKAKPDKGK